MLGGTLRTQDDDVTGGGNTPARRATM